MSIIPSTAQLNIVFKPQCHRLRVGNVPAEAFAISLPSEHFLTAWLSAAQH